LTVKMEWIDSVFSLAYQTAKVAARATAKSAVVSSRATPRLSVILSAIRARM
jgi:hypothetical protein